MKAKHTPGPWSMHEHMGGEHTTHCDTFVAHTVYIGAGPVLLGELAAYQHVAGVDAGYARVTDFDVNRANAALVIAAPDLLDALREAADYISSHVPDDGRGNRDATADRYERQPLLDKVRAAIAMAEGAA